MDINKMTVMEAKEKRVELEKTLNDLNDIFNEPKYESGSDTSSIGSLLDKYVIVRTYSSGVWFGLLSEKEGEEVILTEARRMWRWWAKKSISLSGVAVHGIKHSESKICPRVERVWLTAIEIIPTSAIATKDLLEARDVIAE